MPISPDTIKAVFFAALEKEPGERSTFLDSACQGDRDLRQRVEALLQAYRESDPLLDRPAAWHLEVNSTGQAADGSTPLPPLHLSREALDLPELTQAGRFRLLEEIARGGMGAVLRAHDPDMDRPLAVKIILPQYRDDPSLVRRFLGEARLAGQLQHPGVVPIHDIGRLADGRPFFAMKLIEGRTLAQLLRERPEPGHDLPRFLRYFEAVCQAVGYTHSKGVIHRDLKPENVMVGAFGEVQVMDWGLAKVIGLVARLSESGQAPPDSESRATPAGTEDSIHTQPGTIVGTPGYLAPEQARGLASDRRTDVFSLGAILCEVLTGAPPFSGASRLDLLRQAREGDLSDATDRLDRCGAGAELVRLAKDCLMAEPAARPADASAVAARLAEYLAGVQERLHRAELGQARAEARVEGERTRRRLAVGLAAAVFAVVALGGGSVLVVQRYQAEQAREQARRQQAGESALARAADLKKQGRWDEALAVLHQARQRLDERDGPLSDDVRRAAAELELVGRLEKVRLRAATYTSRSFAWARADREYESEFCAAGLGGPDEPAEAVAQRVRASGVRAALVAALDSWAEAAGSAQRRDWVRVVARSADQGGDWARRLRASWDDPEALAALAHKAPIDQLSPHLLRTLGEVLRNHRLAVPLLRKALLHYPGDFWLTFSLAGRLVERGQHAEATGFYWAALAARPGTPAVLVNLGLALKAQNKPDEACDCYRRALVLDPEFVPAYNNLGLALQDRGQSDEAIVCFRQAIPLDPKDARTHYNLGRALYGKGQVDEAIACFKKASALDPTLTLPHLRLGAIFCDVKRDYDGAVVCFRQAVALDPMDARAHHNLGRALYGKGKVDEAIASFQKASALDPKLTLPLLSLGAIFCDVKRDYDAAIVCFRQVIALNPRDAGAHFNLGLALSNKGKVDEAIACFQKASALDPKDATAHFQLGLLLHRKGQLDEAIASFRKALELDPSFPETHACLGGALLGQKKLDEAITHLRKAIELSPSHAQAHCNLGHALQRCGDFAEALAAMQRGHDLGSKRAGWPYDSAAWVRQCQGLVEREKKLLDVLAGKAHAAGAAELAEYAALGEWTRRFAGAARLWAEALRAEPKLADDLKAARRCSAAHCAALAAAGKGRDSGGLDGAQKSALRKQALDWLKADLAARAKQPAGERAAMLRRWQADEALAAVRDEQALRALPEAERASWGDFWSLVRKHFGGETGR
jgi:tetratricopeptide (TPR) repeat protein